jgi:hypothetical protein
MLLASYGTAQHEKTGDGKLAGDTRGGSELPGLRQATLPLWHSRQCLLGGETGLSAFAYSKMGVQSRKLRMRKY